MKIAKTLYTLSTALLLSLSTSELLAAEASKKDSAKQSGFTLIDFSHRPYLPELTLSGFYGDKDSSYGGVDILYPIYQSSEHIVFVDVRGVLRESPVKEFNLGTGYRWLNDDASRLYGAYLFYDRKLSTNNNWFNQMTLGGELKAEQWWVGGNVYLPFGTTAHHVDRTYHGTLHPHEDEDDLFIIKHHNETTTEYALRGVDLEVGYSLPWIEDLSVYVGGYYFDHDKTEAVKGPKLGVIYDVASLVEKQLPFVSRLEFEASWQSDKPRGKIWYAGIRLSIPLGAEKGHPQLKGLEKAMTRFVRRDVDAVTGMSKLVSEKKVFKINGKTAKVKQVTSWDELKAATAPGSGIDVIGVNSIITVTGDTYTDNRTTAAVNLLKGQSITGGNITHIVSGNSHTTCIVSGGCDKPPVNGLTLDGSNGEYGHLIRVYTEPNATVDKSIVQRIEDLVLTVPKSDGTDGGQKSAVISNTLGQVGDNVTDGKPNKNVGNDSFNKVVIDNVNANGVIDFTVQTGRIGDITVQDSELSVNNPKAGWGVVRTITQAGEEDAITLSGITGNKITATSNIGTVAGLVLQRVNGSVSGNTFSAITTTGTDDDVDAAGIYIHSGMVSAGEISSNKFNDAITTAGGDAAGVWVNGDMAGTIKGNTFAAITTTGTGDGVDAAGVWVNGDMAGTITGEISSNKFNGAITTRGGDAYGVYVGGAMNSDPPADESLGVEDNTFAAITTYGVGGNADAYGIYVENEVAYMNVIDANKFNGTITTAGGDAYGVYVGGAMNGFIIQNHFSAITSTGDNAYGVYVGGEASTPISDNKFSAITSRSNAYGVYFNGLMNMCDKCMQRNNFTVTDKDGSDAYGISLRSGAPTSDRTTLLSTENNNTFSANLNTDEKKVQIR